MNYIKSGWSYLSSSFTQSEGDANESITDLETSKNNDDIIEEGINATDNETWGDTNEELIEFSDAIDTTDNQFRQLQSDAQQTDVASLESTVMCNKISEQQSHSVNDQATEALFSTAVSPERTNSINMDNPVESGAVLENQTTLKKAEGYTSLEASDSDDSGEFLPPPAAPVGRPVNTESQLNEIIKNLGGDLGILSLEEETHADASNPGEKTIGESLYLTAYDQTICPASEETLFDSFSVTAVEAGLNYNGKTSPDSAIASSSKSSICSLDSVKLNFDSSTLPQKPIKFTDAIEKDRPLTPQLTDGQFWSGSDDTPVDQPFSNSILDTTVKESEKPDENIITQSSQSDNQDKIIQLEVKAKKEGTVKDKSSDLTAENLQNDTGQSCGTENNININQTQSSEIVENFETDNKDQEPKFTSEVKMDEEEIPISRGAYTIDFDNLDDFNPFESKKAMKNSPDIPSKPFPVNVEIQDKVTTDEISESQGENPTVIQSNHIVPEQNIENSVKPDENVSAILPDQPIIPEDKPNVELPTQNENIVANDIEIVQKPATDNHKDDSSKTDQSVFEMVSVQNKVEKEEPVSNQEEEPIAVPKGSYSLDFDNLDKLDPFKTSKGLQNSPTKPTSAYSFDLDKMEDADPFKSSKTLSFSPPKSPVKNNVGLLKHMNNNEEDATLPEPVKKQPTDVNNPDTKKSSDLLIMDDVAGNLENVDPSPKKKIAKKPVLGANRKKVNRPVKKKPPPVKAPDPDPADPEDEIIVPKGSYSINFDDLDNLDPFKTSKGLCNSPTKTPGQPSFTPTPNPEEEILKPVEDSPGKGTPVDPPGLLPVKSTTSQEEETESAVTETKQEQEKVDEAQKSPAKKPVKKKVKKPAAIKPPEPANDEDEIPVPRGTYNLDFDNLDAMNPFQTSKVDPFKSSKVMANSPPASPKTVSEKDNNTPVELNNEKDSEENTTDVAKPREENPVDSEIKTEVKKPVKKTGLAQKKVRKPPAVSKPPEPENQDEDEIPIPKGTYNLDFDNLDAMNPFQTSKGLANSPTDKKPPFDFDSMDPFKPSKAMANSPPASPKPSEEKTVDEKKTVEEKAVDIAAEKPAEQQEKKAEVMKSPKKKSGLARKKLIKPGLKKPPPSTEDQADEEPPIPKGSYNLDFDNMDVMDPFKSSKGLSNSPTKDLPSSGYSMNLDDIESIDPFTPKKTLMMNSPPGSPKPDPAAMPVIEPEKKEPIIEQHSETGKQTTEQLPPTEDENINMEAPLPKGSYNLDFDNMDAMDPFKSSKGLSNSPTKDLPSSGYTMNLDDLESIDPFKPKKSLMMNSPPGSPKHSAVQENMLVDSTPDVDNKMRDTTSVTSIDDPAFQTANETVNISTTERQNEDSHMQELEVTKDNEVADYKKLQQMEFDKMNENEEFYPASSVFQDSASLDYLDQLGGAKPLTESDLRKQSLYVKFDPLVGDSPTKQIDQQISKDASHLNVTRETTESTIDDKAHGDHTNSMQQNSQIITDQNITNQLVSLPGTNDSVTTTNVSSGVELHAESMDSFNQPYLSQQSYNTPSTSLQYTQADLDNARRAAEQEWEKERDELRKREEALKTDVEQLNNVVKEYDRLFAEMSSNGKNGTLTREQQLLKAEHEQSLEDMAALERSHEDLCRRYNRLKSVVSQFKQNEDILKKSTNEVMEEAKATEKKYITLKIKADEEIKKANSELQFVKANAQQEVARAQAQLKMLELKCESLNSQIRDCNRENEELTKLCDELIACSKQAE